MKYFIETTNKEKATHQESDTPHILVDGHNITITGKMVIQEITRPKLVNPEIFVGSPIIFIGKNSLCNWQDCFAGRLIGVNPESGRPYSLKTLGGRDEVIKYANIEFKPGEIYPWLGGECPLPDGVRAKIYFAGGEVCSDIDPTSFSWRRLLDDNRNLLEHSIIAYQPLRLADGYEWGV